jgi:hypothetical protein
LLLNRQNYFDSQSAALDFDAQNQQLKKLHRNMGALIKKQEFPFLI